MRGYFTGRLIAVEVGEKPTDDGKHFVNLSFLGAGSRSVASAWCWNDSPVFPTVVSLLDQMEADPDYMPRIGIDGVVTAKAGFSNGTAPAGPPRLSCSIQALYVLDAQGNPIPAEAPSSSKKATAAANGA